MSEFKGTPGPWLLSGNEIYTEEYGPHIAPLVVLETHLGTTFDEDLANANLIAAAPELLEALQNLKREVVLSDIDLAYIESHFRPHIDRARAAIAKALGQ